LVDSSERNGSHTNARKLSTSRKHMTIRNDFCDRHCFQLYLLKSLLKTAY